MGIAGNVDVARRCVKGHIGHFSSYVAAAYAVSPGNTAPVFTGLNFLPTTPTPGVPLRVRVQINDTNGGPTAGHVVAASLQYYFDSNAPQTVPLQPDTTDDTVTNRYYFEIPANQVTGTTFNYAITAVDNLNATRRLPVAAGTFTPVTLGAPATAIRFNPATFTAGSPLQISAGFSRQLALQVTADGTTWQNISAENVMALSSASLGSITRIAPSSVRFNAVGAGSGQIVATVGALTTSAYVNVLPGLLTHIEITDPNQVIISGTGNLAAGQTFDFDVIGFDSYGNIASVLPAFSTTGGIGSVTVDLTGAQFNAAPTVASGSIVATLAGLTDSISISLYIAPQVTATAPFDNTTGIALNSSIGVTFSQVMDTATLTTNTTSACTGSIQVSSDDFATCVPMVSAAPSFYASNTLAVVQPAANLAGTTIYKIRVTASARNTLSQPLAANYTTPVGFTTVTAAPPSGSNSAIGVLDPTFAGGQFTRLNARPISAIVEASGSMYVVGSVLDVTATPPSQMLVYKLDSSASPVSSFGTAGIVYANPALESWGTSLAFNAARTKLLVGGVRRDAGGIKLLTVWQINLPDGSMDTTFGPIGDGSFSLPDTSDASEDLMQILVDLSSNVFASGQSSLGMTVFQLSSAGLLDGSFAGSGVF